MRARNMGVNMEISTVYNLISRLDKNYRIKEADLSASECKVIQSVMRSRTDIVYDGGCYYKVDLSAGESGSANSAEFYSNPYD
jgi:hypothetical protein